MSQHRLIINTDGGSRGNPGPAAIGVHVADQDSNVVFQLAKPIGVGTNNDAEYQAILASAQWLQTYLETHQLASVQWRLDSMLVVEQLNRRWKLKQLTLKPFFDQVQEILAQLPCPYTIVYVPREQNREADALLNQALDAL